MPTKLKDLRLAVQSQTGDRGAAGMTEIDRHINWNARHIENEADWPELWEDEWLTTVAPEEDGTIAITQGLKAVTGTGTTFPADSASLPRRFALSYTDPYYEVETYTNGTDIDLVEAYTEATETASSFVLYCDRYSLGARVRKIRHMLLMYSGYTNPKPISQRELDEVAAMPVRASWPNSWAFDGYDADGNSVVRLSPVPDDVFRILVRYMREYQELTDPDHEPALLEGRRDLIYHRTLGEMHAMRGDSAKGNRSMAIYQRRLAEEISRGAPNTNTVRMRRFDDVVSDDPIVTYRWPAEG